MSVNKSKPVYSPLRADTSGRYHLLVGMGAGAVALNRVLSEFRTEAPAALRLTQVLYTPNPTATAAIEAAGEAPTELHSFADVTALHRFADTTTPHSFADADALLRELRSMLDRSLMGTRLYVAGPESFIGRVLQIALSFNLNKDEIRAEHVGTLARRVHCVHCRTRTEDVRTNIVRCDGCARWLMVRDHYSRRFAAYMGVMIDAEAPGELPPLQEVFT